MSSSRTQGKEAIDVSRRTTSFPRTTDTLDRGRGHEDDRPASAGTTRTEGGESVPASRAALTTALESANADLTEARAMVTQLTEQNSALSDTIDEKDAEIVRLTEEVSRLREETERLRRETGLIPLTDGDEEDSWDSLTADQQRKFDAAEDAFVDAVKKAPEEAQDAIFVHMKLAVKLAKKHKVEVADLKTAFEKAIEMVSIKMAGDRSAKKKRKARRRFRNA